MSNVFQSFWRSEQDLFGPGLIKEALHKQLQCKSCFSSDLGLLIIYLFWLCLYSYCTKFYISIIHLQSIAPPPTSNPPTCLASNHGFLPIVAPLPPAAFHRPITTR